MLLEPGMKKTEPLAVNVDRLIIVEVISMFVYIGLKNWQRKIKDLENWPKS